MQVSSKLTLGGLFMAALTLALPPPAVRADPLGECQQITANQVETGQCLRDTLSTAEAVMDLALQRAQATADSIDQVTTRPGARPALDRAQVAWTAFRDIDCQVPGALAAGGSGSGQFIANCQIEMTRARTRELDTLAAYP